jgi:DNA polymerase III epsilon subunit-like protein
VPRRITALTGIDDAAVAEAPPLAPVIRSFRRWLGAAPRAPFVAHNAGFDAGFVSAALAREGLAPLEVPVLCTRRLARRIAPEIGRYSLDHLSAHFGVANRARHRALGDAAATARIWIELLDLARQRHGVRTLGDLLDLQERSPLPAARRRARRARPAARR